METSVERDEVLIDIVAGPEVEEFANALDNCLSPFLSPADKRARILDLPRKYYENATRRLQLARPKRHRNSPDDVDMDVDDAEFVHGDASSADAEEIKRIEKEVQTWDLIRRLLPLRYAAPGSSSFDDRPITTADPAQSDLLHEFLQTDTVAQERHAVLQWLQNNAASGPDIDELARDLLHQADRGDIIAHGWLHTRSTIKLRKSMTAWPHLLDRQQPSIMHSHLNTDSAPLVTQLDPDAGTRQGRKLEPTDEYFERAIWLGCFEHLRRGSSLEVLRDWCNERTEMWRAISMSALLLPVDDKATAEDPSPASLALWRRMCFSLARQGGSDTYERAVYGVLSGDISSVEKVAKRWDDFLFANYNALLRTQFDAFVLGRCPSNTASTLTQSFSSFDAVQFLGDQDGVERRLIRSLESLDKIQDEATEPSKALQAAFIAKDIERHLYEQGLVMTEHANETNQSVLLPSPGFVDPAIVKNKYFNLSQHDGLRIISHVYLLTVLMEKLDSSDGRTTNHQTNARWSFSQGSILAGYTDYLRRAGLQELIPLYCSILETPRQYEVLGWNLIHEEDPEQRLLQLKLVKKVGIDVLKFVDQQAWLFYERLGDKKAAQAVFSIIKDGPPTVRLGRSIRADFFGDEDGAVEIDHEHAIRSLEWLLMVEGMWAKVLLMGTKVYKFFLRYTHLNAARRLMNRVPFDKILQGAMGQDEAEEVWYDDIEFWAQLLERSGVRDVSPGQVLADARNFRGLESLVKALDNLETIASMMVLSTELPSHGDREFWSGVAPSIKKTKELMPPLLKGWLILGIEGGDKELQELRLAYLPETTLAYISALHFAGTGLSRDNLLECMELAAKVAERNSDLTDVFVKSGRMTELVEAFAACSKALAVSTGDKRSTGSSSKKLREMGWSRDLWSVKSAGGDASVCGPT